MSMSYVPVNVDKQVEVWSGTVDAEREGKMLTGTRAEVKSALPPCLVQMPAPTQREKWGWFQLSSTDNVNPVGSRQCCNGFYIVPI